MDMRKLLLLTATPLGPQAFRRLVCGLPYPKGPCAIAFKKQKGRLPAVAREGTALSQEIIAQCYLVLPMRKLIPAMYRKLL